MKRYLVLAVLTAATLEATTVYVSNGSTLYQLNSSNASVLSSTTLSTSGVRALTFGPDGTLYGSFSTNQLGTIDPGTGNVTLFAQNFPDIDTGLAFGGSTLYAVDTGSVATGSGSGTSTGSGTGTGTGSGTSGDDIQIVNTSTGVGGTFVACGLTGNGLAIGGDGFAWEGNMGNLAHAAIGSGCTPGGGNSGTSTGSGVTGPILTALSFSAGTMYAIDSNHQQLVSFDGTTFPAGGSPTVNVIGNLPSGASSLAVENVNFAPEPAAVSLLGAGLTGLAGFLYYRRRTRQL